MRSAPYVAALTVALVLTRSATAPGEPLRQPPRPAIPVVPTPPPVPTTCWSQPRYFESLKYGVFEYCRAHLRYEPGAFDCYYFTEDACWVFLPGTQDWTMTHSLGPATVFPCPYAPEPPMCPRLAGH